MRGSVYYKLMVILFSLSLACTASAAEKSGEQLFQTMKCNGCHDATVKKRGPSLQTIANAYADTNGIFLYFSGKSGPIVEPERERTMRPRLRKIMKLNESEQKALASYIAAFKK